MDPFTQRMLERAKARREKLDTKLTNAGQDVKRRRSPLRDANAILAQVPVITDVIAKKSPIKPVKQTVSPSGSPAKTFKKSSPKNAEKTPKNEERNKENGDSQTLHVRSKLQRLGKLYSDNSRELSSPIHKTEEKFAVEEIRKDEKSSKPCARLTRLAALASEINNWEDDLSHPTIVKPTITKAERVQAKLNEQIKTGFEPQPSTSGIHGSNSNTKSPLRSMKWDKTVLETLEAQGFSRSKSNSRLVYDYKDCSQGSNDSKQKSPLKIPAKSASSTALPKISENVTAENNSSSSSPSSSTRSNSSSQHLKTPEKLAKSGSSSAGSPAVSNARMNSRFAYNSSPKSSLAQSPGSVLSKASMFESKGTPVKTKDPAEMSLSERKALFERNKGEALIPKAPLTMSVPTKVLQEKEKSNGDSSSNSRFRIDTGRAVEAQRTLFEQGTRTQELENNILQNVQAERQRELEMLRSRFNINREKVQSVVSSGLRTSESSEGKPNSPKSSPVCQVKPTPANDQVPPPPPPLPPTTPSSRTSGILINFKNSPSKRPGVTSPPKVRNEVRQLADTKRVKVSMPKSGSLYPDLTSIEISSTDTETEFTIESTTEAETATLDEPTETETETEAEYYVRHKYRDDSSSDEDDDIGNTSLGRSILEAVNQQSAFNKKRSMDDDPDSSSDISVLDEMDEYLEECLAAQDVEEGPTPPKLNKAGKSPSATSHSFKYNQGPSYRSPIKIVSPVTSSRKKEQYAVEGDNYVPLVHSISLYRKQHSQTPKTPVRVISRVPDASYENTYQLSDDRETALVQEKVKRLLEEIQKQQTIIGQASQALNLCNSTIEFSGSREQVEGERLLLVATHRRQAALNEVQRLKIEGTLRPVVPGAPEVQESGCLTISAITLPLKKDFFHHVDSETCLHFVCLVRHLDTVIATPVVQAEAGDSCLRFPSTLKLQELYSDFKVTVEVYSLQTRAEILPHEIKYHIHNSGSSCSTSSVNKKGGSKTPKKFLKQESKLIMPHIQSPAGPSAVRSTAFSLSGYVIFSLKEVHRQQFTLNKVPLSSPLETRLQMHVSCELTVSVDHHGFLTMFEDISGFGAWHRRWCLLKGATLSYWKYPDDERKKTPIGSLDLQNVTTTNVNLVSRDICARPNTFLLETTRPAESGDADSLVTIRNGSQTTIRHLLSADTKEDRLEWCAKLNKCLHLIHAWGGTST